MFLIQVKSREDKNTEEFRIPNLEFRKNKEYEIYNIETTALEFQLKFQE